MKKRINFRRLLTALVCCCLLITGFSFNTNATESNERPVLPTIDFEQTGTLTLYKYENTADGSFENKGNPVTGAEFTAYKVASISSNGVVSLIGNQEFTPVTVVNKGLINTVKASYSQSPLPTGLKEYESSESQGVYTFGNMELGIYLVVETESPDGYYATTDAFLVSIPQTNQAGNAWEYDVVAYPKNKLIEVKKSVTGGEIKADSYSIGDKVPFIVTSTIPKYTDKAYTFNENKERTGIASNVTLEYYFTDTMSDGLTFLADSPLVVTAGNTVLTKDTHYTVSIDEDTNKITINLTNLALAIYAGESIRLEYSATLNENAEITEGEMNSVTLTFTTNPQTGENYKTDPETTKVYTYQMDVTKTFEGGKPANANINNVKFTLKHGNTNLYAKNVGGVWVINTSITSAANGYTTELTLNSSDKLVIKGLKAGNYTLTEISTLASFNLLKSPITIVVEETKDNNIVTGVVKATVDGKLLETNGTGSFTFEVKNTKGFELPKTGGMGTWMYTIGGLFLMAATAALMFTLKRRNAVK